MDTKPVVKEVNPTHYFPTSTIWIRIVKLSLHMVLHAGCVQDLLDLTARMDEADEAASKLVTYQHNVTDCKTSGKFWYIL